MTMNPRDEDDNELTIERTLGQRMHAFSNMISGHFYGRTEQAFGISLPEWRVLRSALLSPNTSQNAIALGEGLNVMNVSRAVAGLRRKGLVTVEPDPADRRKTMIKATERGIAIGADVAGREQLVYEQIFAILSADELTQLDEMLDNINTRLRTTELPDPPPASQNWAEILSSGSD